MSNKISLATYNIKVKEKKSVMDKENESSGEYLKLNDLKYSTLLQFNESTNVQPMKVQDILCDLLNEDGQGFLYKSSAIKTCELHTSTEENIIYGKLYYGKYGSEQPVLDIDDDNLEEIEEIYIKKKNCPVIPYYFLIKLPIGRKEGLVIFEKKGISGVKTIFDEWLRKYLTENKLFFDFDITPFTPKEAIKQYAEEGKIREIRYLSYKLPSDDFELLNEFEPEEGYFEMKFVFPNRIDKLKNVPHKLREILQGNENEVINDKMFGEIDPDDIKINVVLDKSPRTFTISNPNKAAPYRDITMEIKEGEDGHPDFDGIHKIALKYADEIFN